MKLRELIRSVRACKTMAEERSVITTEAARIRTAFKEEAGTYRHRNVAKILFISMLGYPSHFSHMECLKLIASTRFAEKRIGYLGLMLLLRGDEEVLTLVTTPFSKIWAARTSLSSASRSRPWATWHRGNAGSL